MNEKADNPYLKVDAPLWARLIFALRVIINKNIPFNVENVLFDGKRCFVEVDSINEGDCQPGCTKHETCRKPPRG